MKTRSRLLALLLAAVMVMALFAALSLIHIFLLITVIIYAYNRAVKRGCR